MKYKKSAEITVFLTLIFSILSLMIIAAIKSTKMWQKKQQVEIITDISVNSAFSEYNKSLFENYGLLYIDTTYKGISEGGRESFKYHVAQYADANTPSELTLKGVTIEDEVFASDAGSLDKMISELGVSIDQYIFSAFSYKLNKKPISLNEYEIEYIAFGDYKELKRNDFGDDNEKDMDYAEAEEELEDFSDDEYISILKDKLLDVPEYEKLHRVSEIITQNMKEKYSQEFDLSKHLEKGKVILYFEDENGTIITCQR